MVLDKGGKDDRSFNESAVKGFDEARKKLSINKESKYVEPKSDAQISQFFRVFSTSAKCDLIIGVGYSPSEYLSEFAKKYTNIKFLALDSNLEDKNSSHNIRSITFQEHDGSFLVGAIASMKAKNGSIGFIGGMDIPLIHRFETGYVAGAKYINPEIKISSAFVGITPEAWNNPAKAKELALSQYNDGVEIIYQVAANSGHGVFDAAVQMNNKFSNKKKHYAIGVDSNQNWINPEVIITSMVKRIDRAVFSSIEDLLNNKFKPEHFAYSLKDGGVDWAYDKHNKKFYTDIEIKKIKEIKEKIISGKITVPDYYKTKVVQ